MGIVTPLLFLQHTSKLVIAKNKYKGKPKAEAQSAEELDNSTDRVKVTSGKQKSAPGTAGVRGAKSQN